MAATATHPDLRALLAPTRSGPRRWGWREAVAAYLLLAVVGWRIPIGHPWPQVAWPSSTVSIFVWGAVVVTLVWVFLMSDTPLRVPARLARLIGVVALVGFAGWMLPLHFAQRYVADNTEALEVGARALLGGANPYRFETSLGNPVGPLLGGLVLAVPQTLLLGGSLDLQGLLWLAGLAWFVDRRWGPWPAATLILVLVLTPWARATLPYANDNGITAAGVVVAGSLGHHLATRPRARQRWWWPWLWGGLFACTLVYRYTMWGAVVPLAALLVSRVGWRETVRWLAPAGLVSAVLVVAPLLNHPEAYAATWHEILKGNRLATPHASVILAVVVVVLLVATLPLARRGIAGVWGAYALVLSGLLLAFALLRARETSLFDALGEYNVAWYTGWVVVFGLAALLMPLEPARPSPAGGGERS